MRLEPYLNGEGTMEVRPKIKCGYRLCIHRIAGYCGNVAEVEIGMKYECEGKTLSMPSVPARLKPGPRKSYVMTKIVKKKKKEKETS